MTSDPLMHGVLVGLGVMGTNHLRVLRSMPGVDLAHAVDPDPARRAAAEQRHPGLTTHATLQEALRAAGDVDFAGLATPVGALPALCAEAVDAGLHVLVEKPTAPTEAEALEMIRHAEERGVTLGVGHIERSNPAVVALKRKLDEGAIGRVLQMHARRLSPFPNRQGSQGVALDLSTHDIDVMRYITGQDVARVSAQSATPLSSDDHEDLLCATLRFDGGSIGLLETNWMTPTKVRQLSVLGTLGMLVVDYLTQDLILYDHPTQATDWDHLAAIRGGGEGDMIRFGLERREPLQVQWSEFLAAARSGHPAPITGRDGLAALSTALAIRASAAADGEPTTPTYREHADA